MNYNVKGTGLQVSDEIRAYVEKRLAHAEKFLGDDPTAHVDVEVAFQTSEDRKKFRAEFTLAARGEVYRAESFGDTLHESIDLASDDLTKELSRSKKKHQHLLRRGSTKIKDMLRGFGGRS